MFTDIYKFLFIIVGVKDDGHLEKVLFKMLMHRAIRISRRTPLCFKNDLSLFLIVVS